MTNIWTLQNVIEDLSALRAAEETEEEDAASYHSSLSDYSESNSAPDDAFVDNNQNSRQPHSLRRITAHVRRLRISSTPDLPSTITEPESVPRPTPIVWTRSSRDTNHILPTSQAKIEQVTIRPDRRDISINRCSSNTAVPRSGHDLIPCQIDIATLEGRDRAARQSVWSTKAMIGSLTSTRSNSSATTAARRESNVMIINDFTIPIRVQRPSITGGSPAAAPKLRYWKVNEARPEGKSQSSTALNPINVHVRAGEVPKVLQIAMSDSHHLMHKEVVLADDGEDTFEVCWSEESLTAPAPPDQGDTEPVWVTPERPLMEDEDDEQDHAPDVFLDRINKKLNLWNWQRNAEAEDDGVKASTQSTVSDMTPSSPSHVRFRGEQPNEAEQRREKLGDNPVSRVDDAKDDGSAWPPIHPRILSNLPHSGSLRQHRDSIDLNHKRLGQPRRGRPKPGTKMATVKKASKL